MTDLPQDLADALLSMPKWPAGEAVYRLPPHRSKLMVPLRDKDEREEFIPDIFRGGISLERRTHQTRGRQIYVLARLDFGSPHRNPDGEEIGVPHLHLYREGFGDKWAYPVPQEKFPNLGDMLATLNDFMAFCNVVEPPVFEPELLP